MTDQELKDNGLRHASGPAGYNEETSAELTVPAALDGGQSSNKRVKSASNIVLTRIDQGKANHSTYREETASELVLTRTDWGNTTPSLKKNSSSALMLTRIDGGSNRKTYKEEIAAEIAAPAPVGLNRSQVRENNRSEFVTENEKVVSGRGIGFAALALSILSLFVMPILFGAAGIVLGFIARRKGATGLGNWAIGLGAISIIVGMFIVPFF